jgi:hypothetical protein
VQILGHPLVQSAALPLLAALLGGALAARWSPRAAGAFVPLGFLASAWLVVGIA